MRARSSLWWRLDIQAESTTAGLCEELIFDCNGKISIRIVSVSTFEIRIETKIVLFDVVVEEFIQISGCGDWEQNFMNVIHVQQFAMVFVSRVSHTCS